MKNKKTTLTANAPKRPGDIRSSLIANAAIVIGMNVACYLLMLLYQALGDAAYAISVDVETHGSILQILCEIGANIFFYITSFLGTVTFFIGAAFAFRFGVMKKWGKFCSSCGILIVGMSTTTIFSIVAYAVRSIISYLSDTDEHVRLTDPMLLVYDLLFLILQISLATVPALLVARSIERIKPSVLAALSASLIFLSSISLEFFDTILPFFTQKDVIAADVLNLAITIVIYIIHALLGYITYLSFLKNRSPLKIDTQEQN